MPIAIKLFASLRSRFGPNISLQMDLPIQVSELETRLRAEGLWSDGARIAVNHSFASGRDTILEGDEVAVIPPVSGG